MCLTVYPQCLLHSVPSFGRAMGVRRLVSRLGSADIIPSSLWFLAPDVVDAVVCRRKGNDAAFCFGSGPEDKEVYIFVVSSLI